MHIFIRFPLGSIAHWRFGYLRTCFVGLYFPRRRFRLPPMREPFRHIGHVVIKFKARNPKHETISKFQNIKSVFYFEFKIWNLFRISKFGFRI